MSAEITQPSVFDTPDLTLDCILDMGEILLSSGAEVLRVEDTLTRLCKAYRFDNINVFSITSCIILTANIGNDRIYTQTRRVPNRSTNLQKVAVVNALSREICKSPIPAGLLKEKIAEIQHIKAYSAAVQCLSYTFIASAFTIFFGGTFLDSIAAAFSGAFVFFVQLYIQKMRMNNILQSTLTSAFSALFIVLMVMIGLGETPDKIIIGNIMLLIPGVAFTTALRDLVNGDTLSGLVGLCESVLKAIAIAIGFAVILVGFGGVL